MAAGRQRTCSRIQLWLRCTRERCLRGLMFLTAQQSPRLCRPLHRYYLKRKCISRRCYRVKVDLFFSPLFFFFQILPLKAISLHRIYVQKRAAMHFLFNRNYSGKANAIPMQGAREKKIACPQGLFVHSEAFDPRQPQEVPSSWWERSPGSVGAVQAAARPAAPRHSTHLPRIALLSSSK